ncbi:hypothetical protein CC1G_06227 [Coprinopsis cinerea okayama7|uniref:Uncharacterized protein n=1 Tax=Coprinopsis cinerea (strain Okayama-7 / 130 / ATCC MYA-4618 / FGSC 9003) TaxID=240176 RepID=A8NVA7_COPC7|nr:hypothetical protein CC1G_06227 [Coprinopsis cinerea okayama7\|eukprot:XP_001836640.1 hypothetical protein CC1G_06227 [Coprinopsis cinerea okayama7\
MSALVMPRCTGTRMWRPHPVVPFLAFYSSEQLAQFMRTHLDDPFSEKFAKFVETVNMTGSYFTSMDDDTLSRLCGHEPSLLYDLQRWKTALTKPRTPSVRTVFELPPISPTVSPAPSEPSTLHPESDREVPVHGDADRSDDWDDFLLSTPESTQSAFTLEDQGPLSPHITRAQHVDVVETRSTHHFSPLISRHQFTHYDTHHHHPGVDDDKFPYSNPSPESDLDGGSSTAGDNDPLFSHSASLSRRSSTASLRSNINVLNFDSVPTPVPSDLFELAAEALSSASSTCSDASSEKDPLEDADDHLWVYEDELDRNGDAVAGDGAHNRACGSPRVEKDGHEEEEGLIENEGGPSIIDSFGLVGHEAGAGDDDREGGTSLGIQHDPGLLIDEDRPASSEPSLLSQNDRSQDNSDIAPSIDKCELPSTQPEDGPTPRTVLPDPASFQPTSIEDSPPSLTSDSQSDDDDGQGTSAFEVIVVSFPPSTKPTTTPAEPWPPSPQLETIFEESSTAAASPCLLVHDLAREDSTGSSSEELPYVDANESDLAFIEEVVPDPMSIPLPEDEDSDLDDFQDFDVHIIVPTPPGDERTDSGDDSQSCVAVLPDPLAIPLPLENQKELEDLMEPTAQASVSQPPIVTTEVVHNEPCLTDGEDDERAVNSDLEYADADSRLTSPAQASVALTPVVIHVQLQEAGYEPVVVPVPVEQGSSSKPLSSLQHSDADTDPSYSLPGAFEYQALPDTRALVAADDAPESEHPGEEQSIQQVAILDAAPQPFSDAISRSISSESQCMSSLSAVTQLKTFESQIPFPPHNSIPIAPPTSEPTPPNVLTAEPTVDSELEPKALVQTAGAALENDEPDSIAPTPELTLTPATPSLEEISQTLTEVFIKQQVLTNGCLGLSLSPELEIIQTPVSPSSISLEDVRVVQSVEVDRRLDDGVHVAGSEDATGEDKYGMEHAPEKPKLEIDISSGDSLFSDELLSALISSVSPSFPDRPFSITRSTSFGNSPTISRSSSSSSSPSSSDKYRQWSRSGTALPFSGRDYDRPRYLSSPYMPPNSPSTPSSSRLSVSADSPFTSSRGLGLSTSTAENDPSDSRAPRPQVRFVTSDSSASSGTSQDASQDADDEPVPSSPLLTRFKSIFRTILPLQHDGQGHENS